jgi:hypothetical protein
VAVQFKEMSRESREKMYRILEFVQNSTTVYNDRYMQNRLENSWSVVSVQWPVKACGRPPTTDHCPSFRTLTTALEAFSFRPYT